MTRWGCWFYDYRGACRCTVLKNDPSCAECGHECHAQVCAGWILGRKEWSEGKDLWVQREEKKGMFNMVSDSYLE